MANLQNPRLHFCSLCSLLLFAIGNPSTSYAEDAVDRLQLQRLRSQHTAIESLKETRVDHRVDRPYRDFRANLHVHSSFSHDSRGKIEDIVAAANKVGTKVLMFTEHPAPHYDFFQDGHQGTRDGVLLVPGAEMNGFLTYPKQSIQAFASAEKQEFSDIVRSRGGLTFISHLEERMDWKIQGVTGCEIYNTHADFKNEKRLLSSLKNPLWLIQAKKMFDLYPQEALSALFDYPEDYLKRFDQLCQVHPHTGVSANDAHQNVGLVLRLQDDDKVSVEDPIGEKLFELDRRIVGAIVPIREDTTVGSELFRLQLDPYERSLKHVGTHLLMKELTVDEVWDALQSGRAFVAFDWMADSSGFDLALHRAGSSGDRMEMGSQTEWSKELELRGYAGHPVHWKIYRDGELVHKADGDHLAWKLPEPGIYRTEAWLSVNGESMIWILANPFYVKR